MLSNSENNRLENSKDLKKAQSLKKMIDFIKKFLESFDRLQQKEINFRDFCSNFLISRKNLTLEKVISYIYFIYPIFENNNFF